MDAAAVRHAAQQTAFRLAAEGKSEDALRMGVNETVVGLQLDAPAEDLFRSVIDEVLAVFGGAANGHEDERVLSLA